MIAQPKATESASELQHTRLDDVFAILTGTFVASLGIYLLKTAHPVIGGTAGLALLLSYASGWQ